MLIFFLLNTIFFNLFNFHLRRLTPNIFMLLTWISLNIIRQCEYIDNVIRLLSYNTYHLDIFEQNQHIQRER